MPFSKWSQMKRSQWSLTTLEVGIISPWVTRKHYDAMPPCFMSITPIERRRVEQVPVLQLESCEAEVELTDSPVGQRTLPMTTKLRSCFPPCRFSSSALTSICCLSLPDFLTGVCVELCSSDAWMVWDGTADLETESRTSEEAMLVSSLGCPFWGVWKTWPFSSAVTLKKAEIGKEC